MNTVRTSLLVLSLAATGQISAQTTELEPNDTLGSATAIAFDSAIPADSRLSCGHATGNISSSGDIDWWSIQLNEGDALSLYVDNEDIEVDLRYYDPSEAYLGRVDGGGSDGASTGDDLLGRLVATQTGTYFFRIYPETSATGPYQIHGILSRGIDLENDSNFRNDSQASADPLEVTGTPGVKTAAVAGRVIGPYRVAFDEDYFGLGILNAGNQIDLSLAIPEGSTLLPRLRLFGPGGEVGDSDGNSENGEFSATLPATGAYFVLVQSNGEWVHANKRYRWFGQLQIGAARDAASGFGGVLLQLKDADTAAFFDDALNSVQLWLGLSDEVSEGTWVWADGTLLSATYSNWATREPNTSSYDLAFRNRDGFWYDTSTNSSLYAVAEKPAIGASEAGPGTQAIYLLEATVADTVPPIPAKPGMMPVEGGTTDTFLTGFAQSFDEPVVNTEDATSGNVRVYSHGDNAYVWVAGTYDWPSAQAQATAMGGYLVVPNDEAEQIFLDQHFSRWGSFWIGLTHTLGTALQWEDGSASGYTNWAGNEPNTGSYHQAYLDGGNGYWYDSPQSSQRGLVVELESPVDTDGDGMPDVVDAYPGDALNVFDLREAGIDGLFDTVDDHRYQLHITGSGTDFSITILDGPLPSGHYRYRIGSQLLDNSDNAVVVFEHIFTVDLPFQPDAGFVQEGSDWNERPDYAGELPLTTDTRVPVFKTAQGEGSLSPDNDLDWWKVDLEAGQRLAIHSSGNQLSTRIDLYSPNGSHITYDRFNGPDQDAFLSGLTISETGTYTIRVSRYTYDWNQDYRLWLTVLDDVPMETDANNSNDSIAGADSVQQTVLDKQRMGQIGGDIMRYFGRVFDRDYFDLGILNAGNQINLSLDLPDHSTLLPRMRVIGPDGEITDADGILDNAFFTSNLTVTGDYTVIVESNQEWVREELRYRYAGALTFSQARDQANLAGGRLLQLLMRC